MDEPLDRLLELLKNGRVLKGRNILRNLLTLRQGTQEPTHNFSRPGLRQVVTEPNFLVIDV